METKEDEDDYQKIGTMERKNESMNVKEKQKSDQIWVYGGNHSTHTEFNSLALFRRFKQTSLMHFQCGSSIVVEFLLELLNTVTNIFNAF